MQQPERSVGWPFQKSRPNDCFWHISDVPERHNYFRFRMPCRRDVLAVSFCWCTSCLHEVRRVYADDQVRAGMDEMRCATRPPSQRTIFGLLRVAGLYAASCW